jgi:hypothetical protein
MSTPVQGAIVHVAAPLVAGADSQWCRDCGHVIMLLALEIPPWPPGAVVALAGQITYLISIFGDKVRPLVEGEQRCNA